MLQDTNISDTFIKCITTKPLTLPLLSEMLKHSGPSLLGSSRRIGNGITFKVNPSTLQEFFHMVEPIVEAIVFRESQWSRASGMYEEAVDDQYCNSSSPWNLLILHSLVFLL